MDLAADMSSQPVQSAPGSSSSGFFSKIGSIFERTLTNVGDSFVNAASIGATNWVNKKFIGDNAGSYVVRDQNTFQPQFAPPRAQPAIQTGAQAAPQETFFDTITNQPFSGSAGVVMLGLGLVLVGALVLSR